MPKVKIAPTGSPLGEKFTCPHCLREHYIPTRKAVYADNAFALLPDFCGSLFAGKKILVLSDRTTFDIAGKRCAETLRPKFEVSEKVISPKGGGRLHAEDQYLAEIISSLKDNHAVLTVGSGTITDLGKYGAEKLGIPAICFPTAASMNAYTSGVAALMLNGLKVAVPVTPALGVITDTGVISAAPPEMTRAGFADSLAKSYAVADWKSAAVLNQEYYCPLPLEIASAAEAKYLNLGAEIAGRNKTAVTHLMKGLNAGGFSMVIAGSSAPASGGEHLISHFLDMYSHRAGREIYALHGLQVGLGVLVSALIYDRLRDLSTAEVSRRLSRRKADYAKELGALKALFPEAAKEFKRKIPVLRKLARLLPKHWEELKTEVFPMTYPAARISAVLQEAACPQKFSDIGVCWKTARQAIMNARYIRDRLTVLDIADELDILPEIAESCSG